ncbi:MAG TPA: FxDxF family PEP-CTERM protein [Methylocystis sp.]|nr:FxDxF family PEP-CTERM protein [Methylocystis sp.]
MKRTATLAVGLVSALLFAGGAANAAVVAESLGTFSETAAENGITFGASLNGAHTGAFTTDIFFTVSGSTPFSLNATESGIFKGKLSSLSGYFQLFSAGGTAESARVGFVGQVAGGFTNEYANLISSGVLNPGTYYLQVNGTGGNLTGSTHGSVGGVIATSSVPEPSTWAMMMIGFVGVAYLGLSRKSAPIAA